MAGFVTITEDLRLDILAAELLRGERDGGLEALLAVNPGLAAAGPFATEGTTLRVPDLPALAPVVLATVNPWE